MINELLKIRLKLVNLQTDIYEMTMSETQNAICKIVDNIDNEIEKFIDDYDKMAIKKPSIE